MLVPSAGVYEFNGRGFIHHKRMVLIGGQLVVIYVVYKTTADGERSIILPNVDWTPNEYLSSREKKLSSNDIRTPISNDSTQSQKIPAWIYGTHLTGPPHRWTQSHPVIKISDNVKRW